MKNTIALLCIIIAFSILLARPIRILLIGDSIHKGGCGPSTAAYVRARQPWNEVDMNLAQNNEGSVMWSDSFLTFFNRGLPEAPSDYYQIIMYNCGTWDRNYCWPRDSLFAYNAGRIKALYPKAVIVLSTTTLIGPSRGDYPVGNTGPCGLIANDSFNMHCLDSLYGVGKWVLNDVRAFQIAHPDSVVFSDDLHFTGPSNTYIGNNQSGPVLLSTIGNYPPMDGIVSDLNVTSASYNLGTKTVIVGGVAFAETQGDSGKILVSNNSGSTWRAFDTYGAWTDTAITATNNGNLPNGYTYWLRVVNGDGEHSSIDSSAFSVNCHRFYWAGSSSSNRFNDSLNWGVSSGGAGGYFVPTVLDTAEYSGVGATANNNCSLTTNVRINSLKTDSAYSGILKLATSTDSIDGDVSLAHIGGLYLNSSVLNLYADIDVDNRLSSMVGGTGTINFLGASACTPTGLKSIYDANVYKTVTAGDSIHANGDISLYTGGTLDMSGKRLYVGGDFSAAGTSTFIDTACTTTVAGDVSIASTAMLTNSAKSKINLTKNGAVLALNGNSVPKLVHTAAGKMSLTSSAATGGTLAGYQMAAAGLDTASFQPLKRWTISGGGHAGWNGPNATHRNYWLSATLGQRDTVDIAARDTLSNMYLQGQFMLDTILLRRAEGNLSGGYNNGITP